MTSFDSFLSALQPEIETALDRLLPAEDLAPQRLHAAMRYSIFAGGKRVRPALVVLAGEFFGAQRQRLLAGAAAMEMIHTFSLIHDDLPALDDDDLRRGRPTLHRQYDEALAILAGDALLNHALGLLVREPADADAGDPPSSVPVTMADNAKGVERCGGRHHVLALEQSGDSGFANRHGRDHQRAVGDRFIAGNPYYTRDPIGRPGTERFHPGPFMHGRRPNRGTTSVTRTAGPRIVCSNAAYPANLVLTG